MPLRSAFFPAANRDFQARRWTSIVLRTLHLVGTAGVGGGYLYGAPAVAWKPYLLLTVVSGLALVALELWTNGVFIVQLRGLAIGLKLILLAGLHLAPPWCGRALIASVIISGLISHAPGAVRHYSPFHRRRIESL